MWRFRAAVGVVPRGDIDLKDVATLCSERRGVELSVAPTALTDLVTQQAGSAALIDPQLSSPQSGVNFLIYVSQAQTGMNAARGDVHILGNGAARILD